ncbi:UNVERIFIED_CONTAM: hypothetical protein GTU68_007327 [Idotea baltica]|nr:hypothetical protein [Idotea baltica]
MISYSKLQIFLPKFSLQSHPDAQVDIYEKLPVPFGLVRYGVAPDHPEVKNCINAFTEVAKQNRVSFFGNIAVGKDVTLDQLKESYHAVVLAYGAAKDRTLNIPGENLPNVLPARRLVGWYNGLPEDSNLDVDLNVEDVVVIGQGNVAIDVARILLTPIDILRKTDIPEPVLEKLSSSRVKRVTMVGRRKAQNVAFTTKELREMINLEGSKPVIRTQDVEALSSVIESAARPRKRLLQLLQQAAMSPGPAMVDKWRGAEREWRLRFLMSPLEILAKEDGKGVAGVKFGINRIEDDAAVLTDGTEMEPCGLVLRSIGYTSVKIDPSIPFDDRKGVIPNEKGRVTGHKSGSKIFRSEREKLVKCSPDYKFSLAVRLCWWGKL